MLSQLATSGMLTPDTLWYHLPQAARFVQTGSILHLQYFDRDPVTVFFPANAELFHALGLMFFRSDLLSPAVNLAWAALALMAAWAIGRPFARGPHCLIAVLLLLATPALVDTQPGGAYNDTACIALVLSAAALLVNGGTSAGPATLAAMAAGLALGIKFTMIAPALALGAGVVAVTARGARWRTLARWAAALIVLLFMGPIPAIVAGLLVAAILCVAVSRRARKRRERFEEQLGDSLQMLSGGLRAGHSLPQAMDALVREAAYAMLTDEDRLLGHRLAGAWLEQAGAADAMVLAEHFRRGAEPVRAARWYERGQSVGVPVSWVPGLEHSDR